MTTVLWVSRHAPLVIQVDKLKEKLGNDVKIVQISGIVPNAKYVIEKAKKLNAKYIVPVLPLSFIARICEQAKEEGITVLWSQMKLLHDDKDEPCEEFNSITDTIVPPNRHYRFEKFYVIRGVRLDLEDW